MFRAPTYAKTAAGGEPCQNSLDRNRLWRTHYENWNILMNKALFSLAILGWALLGGCHRLQFAGKSAAVSADWIQAPEYEFPIYAGRFEGHVATDEWGSLADTLSQEDLDSENDWSVSYYDTTGIRVQKLESLAAKAIKPPAGKAGRNQATGPKTLRLEAADIYTDAELNALIARDGNFTGHTTPWEFTGADFLPGIYSVTLEGYTDWIPASESVRDNSEDKRIVFIGIEQDSVMVELRRFTADVMANYVWLTWEIKLEYFMLEYGLYRSETNDVATAFQIAPTVTAANTRTDQTYYHTDTEVVAGKTYYYWLKAVDYLGSQFFGPVAATIPETKPKPIAANSLAYPYPNPCSKESGLNLRIEVRDGQTATVLLFDRQFKVRKKLRVPEGVNMITYNTSELEPGLYRVYCWFSDGYYGYGDVLVQP